MKYIVLFVVLCLIGIAQEKQKNIKKKLKYANPFGFVMGKKRTISKTYYDASNTGRFSIPKNHEWIEEVRLTTTRASRGRRIIAITAYSYDIDKYTQKYQKVNVNTNLARIAIYERFKRELTAKYGNHSKETKLTLADYDASEHPPSRYPITIPFGLKLTWYVKGYEDVQEIVLIPKINFDYCVIKYYSKEYCDQRDEQKRKEQEAVHKLKEDSKTAL